MSKYPSAEVVARLSFEKFKTLPKTGKPTASEWTVLSTIIQYDSVTDNSKIVALGAGTKCIGQSRLCPLGLILNDSHGEVLARRAFLRYILHQLEKDNEIFEYNKEKLVFCIKGNISFHFFSSQVPCGDACITSVVDDEMPAKRRRISCDYPAIGDELTSGVFTGAKLISSDSTDLMEQTPGVLRIKPGRGDRTLSMSCSDKMSKWNLLGVQGALLDSILEKPIYLETMTFSCDVDVDAVKRAIYERWDGRQFQNDRFLRHKPEIRKASGFLFEHGQDADKNPSPNGLVWCELPDKSCSYEVSVNGKKQGITKKALHTRKASLRISKINILHQFCDLIRRFPEILKKLDLSKAELNKLPYRNFKKASRPYQATWAAIKQSYFQQWTTKPQNLLEFTLESCNKGS